MPSTTTHHSISNFLHRPRNGPGTAQERLRNGSGTAQERLGNGPGTAREKIEMVSSLLGEDTKRTKHHSCNKRQRWSLVSTALARVPRFLYNIKGLNLAFIPQKSHTSSFQGQLTTTLFLRPSEKVSHSLQNTPVLHGISVPLVGLRTYPKIHPSREKPITLAFTTTKKMPPLPLICLL